jgi:hypothetical protein
MAIAFWNSRYSGGGVGDWANRFKPAHSARAERTEGNFIVTPGKVKVVRVQSVRYAIHNA